jgi:uroporphyrinogen III methyltransferase/synthase
VYLVGAGPGDPGLITLRGQQVLQSCDCVVYDRLVAPSLVQRARPDAERVFAGKAASNHSLSQGEINDLLVERARRGLAVCRLKGGDPFLFGRGGEEAERLAQEGIPFEVVPGVSSALAVPAYAGIPLTHRELSSSVSIITGHASATSEGPDLEALAKGSETLVFLMGVQSLARIASRLLRAGLPPETPVAVVERGTYARQRTLVGTLEGLPELVERDRPEPPATLVVGRVVGLRDRLSWYETRPLFGLRVLVTRGQEQAGALSDLLREQGAEAIECPTIRIESLGTAVDLAALATYDWAIFTSANAVAAFQEAVWDAGGDVRALASARIAALGPATEEALTSRGLRVVCRPEDDRAEGMLAALPAELMGARILIPRAESARPVLPEGLRARGATVDILPLYRTSPWLPAEAAPVSGMLARGELDVLTFCSASSVSAFAGVVKQPIPDACTVACLGPVTADAARVRGLRVDVTPEPPYTVPRLVEALADHFRRPGQARAR